MTAHGCPSKGARRLSLIAGLAAGEAYSIYATFFGHALRSPSLYVVDQYTHRHLLPGQFGYTVEVFYWEDLIQLVAVSLLIFGSVWWGTCMPLGLYVKRGTRFLEKSPTRSPSQQIGDLIADSVAPQDALPWVTGFDVESQSYTTSTEHQAWTMPVCSRRN